MVVMEMDVELSARGRERRPASWRGGLAFWLLLVAVIHALLLAAPWVGVGAGKLARAYETYFEWVVERSR